MSDLDYRSWGSTRDCHGCRYWSEMLAESHAGGLRAMCIAHGQAGAINAGRYTTKRQTCAAYAAGDAGAVDSPGGNPYAEAEA